MLNAKFVLVPCAIQGKLRPQTGKTDKLQRITQTILMEKIRAIINAKRFSIFLTGSIFIRMIKNNNVIAAKINTIKIYN